MPIRQKIVVILIAVTLFLIILNLVRRRKLKEEYSWLWLLTGAIIIILTIWYGLLVKLTFFIGAVTPTSTLFLFGFIFLILLCLQLSVTISGLVDKIKNLSQELTILKSKIEKRDED
jgi:hypothetical protein